MYHILNQTATKTCSSSQPIILTHPELATRLTSPIFPSGTRLIQSSLTMAHVSIYPCGMDGKGWKGMDMEF